MGGPEMVNKGDWEDRAWMFWVVLAAILVGFGLLFIVWFFT
jgi:hypothetical protein